jgi:H+/Cl- antiporter ClcA
VQSEYAWQTIFFTLLAALALAADWRRHHRREAYRAAARAAWVPWPLIAVLALIAAALCAAMWLRGD